MRYCFTIMLAILLVVGACKPSKDVFDNFLYQSVTTTETYSLTKINLIDDRVKLVLDSAISISEKCHYFDKRIPYYHAFFVSALIRDGENSHTFRITAGKSVSDAIGVRFQDVYEFQGRKPPVNGAFFYRNYLFAVPLHPETQELDSLYSFFEKSDCEINVNATSLPDERSKSSYLEYRFINQEVKIVKNEICGAPITIH